jgi:beta-glucosidase
MFKQIATAIGCLATMCPLQAQQVREPFRWGAASAAYQVEGASSADDKGPSIWDVYLDDHQLAGPGVSGRVAINFYDRDQYLRDIVLMKQMGLVLFTENHMRGRRSER